MKPRRGTGFCILIALSLIALPTFAGQLTLEFNNLAPLDEATEGLYEGWAIIDGQPVSTGVFNVNAEGLPVQPGGGPVIDFFAVGDEVGLSSAIKISLEPAGDSDPGPSGLIVLTGDVMGEMVDLHPALPGLDQLMTATGDYILATPSDNAMDTENDDEGIWYLIPPDPMPGLVGLPDLGASWTYEGWIVDFSGGMPVPYSTGTFAMGAGFDSDQAGCNGGGPPFPGQDFSAYHCGPILDLDTGDFAAVISIEPVPDNGDGPFQFKPLAGMIPVDALENGGQLANQTEATFPCGSATIIAPVSSENRSWGDLKQQFRR